MCKRTFTALLLCAALLLTVLLAACKAEEEDSGSSAVSAGPAVSGEGLDEYHDAAGKYWPSYSDEQRDEIIGGRTEVRVLVYNNVKQSTYYSEEIEPELYPNTDAKLNEAVTERNNYVAQQLGVEVKAVPVDDVLATMRQEMLVPSDTFDIAMPFLNACAVLAQENAFYDLREFEQEGILDLSAPWYDQNANASISIENRSYFTVSDMSIMQKIVSFSVTYNPELLATKFPDLDLFQTVVDGEWTLDRMLELGRSFAGDADGNGTMDYTDEWGLVSSQGDAIQFYLASGETLCAKDENDDPIISIGGARSLSVSQKILETLQQKDWVILYQDILAQGVPASEGSNTALRIFGDGRALFRISAFSAIKKLRAYDVEYAVVPMPLADSTQTEYYTPCSAVYAYGIGIPSSLSEEDARFAAYMMDVLSAGGKEYIATAYYDQILKNKDALSDTSREVDILDLIVENVVYDVGYIYGFSGLSTMHTTLMANDSTDISSHLESIRGQVNQKIEEVVAQFRK